MKNEQKLNTPKESTLKLSIAQSVAIIILSFFVVCLPSSAAELQKVPFSEFGEIDSLPDRYVSVYHKTDTNGSDVSADNKLKYVPGEIIVKFKRPITDGIEQGKLTDASVRDLKLSPSIDKLNKKFRLRNIHPLFKNFKANRTRLEALQKRDKTSLSEKEKHILGRLARAPKGAKVPELYRIYKINFDLESGQSIEDVVREYKSNPDVEYAELNYIVEALGVPNDPLYSQLWGMAKIEAPDAWDIHTGSSDIVVAVVDTGVDYTHRDLAANMWVNEAELHGTAGVDDDGNGYVDDIYGYDFINNDSNPWDDAGHGTHCSGTIAGVGNNGLDVVGVCWNARIMALKFLGAGGSGSTSDAISAFYYAVENGADVTSNSWGGGGYEQSMKDAIDYAYSQGVVMVAAAGNAGNTTHQYPAYYDHMISVAATDSSDRKASFSTYGNWVDIAAPGVSILSLKPGGGTATMSGTSMACPHVAGASALLLSANPILTPDEVYDILTSTTDPIATGVCISGRLNIGYAILAAASSKGRVSFDHDYYSCSDQIGIRLGDSGLAGQGSHAVTVTTDGGDLETVVLTEIPGTTIGAFKGTIATGSGTVNTEDGTVQVRHNEIITVTYEDANDGMGSPETVTDTARTDCAGPVVLNVQITSKGPTRTVIIETDEPAACQVLCGTSCGGPYPVEANNMVLKTSHSITLKGFDPNTDYFFIIETTDVFGNVAVDNNSGSCYTFTTEADPGPIDVYVPSQFPTIQDAVDYLWYRGTVWVADGIYTGNGNRDIDFGGRAITVRSVNGPNNCIINCQGSYDEFHRGFVFRNDEDANSVLQGFTITYGFYRRFDPWETSTMANNGGGGVVCIESSPTIRDCIFKWNIGGLGSAVAMSDNSSPMISQCVFSNNKRSSAIFIGSPFTKNSNCKPTITNCVFSNNIGSYGSAIFSKPGSNVVIANCMFYKNSGSEGGAINTNGDFTHMTITDCVFVENFASNVGGAIINIGKNIATITNCIFSSNRAVQQSPYISSGGAIINCYGSEATMTNCVFLDNVANMGGAIEAHYSHSCIINCTFSENRATRYNQGNALFYWILSDVEVTNCILWDDGDEIYYEYDSDYPSTITVNYSDVQGGYSGEGNIDENPNLAFSSDYHLMAGSPCIDAGTNSPAGGLPATDIDGNPRVINGGGSITADMGAHEYDPNNPSIEVWPANICFFRGLAQPAAQTLSIKNCSASRSLNWKIVDINDCNWLTINPTSGTLSGGQIDEVTLTVDTKGLSSDNHICTFKVFDPNAANSPKLVVELEIGGVANLTKGIHYETIQDAIDAASVGNTIEVEPDYYYETIDFKGKNITLRSGQTTRGFLDRPWILTGSTPNIVTFSGGEDANCVLESFKITRSNDLITPRSYPGILCNASSPTIKNCIVYRHSDKAFLITNASNPTIQNCFIGGNLGYGIEFDSTSSANLINCTISENLQGGILGGSPVVSNSILWNKDVEYEIVGTSQAVVSYSNIKGGFPGEGNIDIDPKFVDMGHWYYFQEDYKNWMPGNFNLQDGSNCINAGDPNYIAGPNETDFDGKPRIIGPRIDMGAYEFNHTLFANAGPDQTFYAWIDGKAKVILDGSDSNDADGDELTYKWTWTIDANIYEANGVSPTIELPVGVHTIQLVVNDGYADSAADDVNVTVVAPLEGTLKITPTTINRKSNQPDIRASIKLPGNIAKNDVDLSEPLVLYPGGIKATSQQVSPAGNGSQKLNEIATSFDKAALMNAVPADGNIELKVAGKLKSGQYFYGCDTVKVIK